MKACTRKHFAHLALLILLLVGTLLFVGCDKNQNKNKPAETPAVSVSDSAPESAGETAPETETAGESTPETKVETETEIETETETETVVATEAETEPETMDAAAYLDRLLSAEDVPSDNYKTVTDMDITVHAVASNGYKQDVTVPGIRTEIVDGTNMLISSEAPDGSYTLIYVDGVMYVEVYGDLLQCPATPEQFTQVVELLEGNDTEEDSDSSDLGDLLTGMPAAEIFASITAEKQSGGSTVVTAKGFRDASADKLAPSMMSFFLSMGMIGQDLNYEDYETEEELEAALIAQTVQILKAMDDDALILTFTTDSEDVLMSIGVKLALSTTMESEGLEIKMDMVIDGDITHMEGGQAVKKPANASDYTEGTWDEFFGTPSPEDFGLVPDENGIITLSDDAELRAEQIVYIYTNTELFSDCAFAVTGTAEVAELADGSTVLSIYAQDAYGAICEYATIEGMFYPDEEDTLKGQIATGEEALGQTYLFIGAFAEIEDEVGDVYVIFVVTGVFPAEGN